MVLWLVAVAVNAATYVGDVYVDVSNAGGGGDVSGSFSSSIFDGHPMSYRRAAPRHGGTARKRWCCRPCSCYSRFLLMLATSPPVARDVTAAVVHRCSRSADEPRDRSSKLIRSHTLTQEQTDMKMTNQKRADSSLSAGAYDDVTVLLLVLPSPWSSQSPPSLPAAAKVVTSSPFPSSLQSD